jgi:SNF2 family DNA or RNA helicase
MILNNNKMDEEENKKVFKQLVNTFLTTEIKQTQNIKNLDSNICIEPTIFYDKFHGTLKIEFKIGNVQMYKLKNLVEFYDKMMAQEVYKYGSKLEFKHTKEAFNEESKRLLDFILKYAEIIKYTNEANNLYSSYSKKLNEANITISKSALDELFEILDGKNIKFFNGQLEENITFLTEEPNIKLELLKNKSGTYTIAPNIDIYSYDTIYGKNYIYILFKNALYKCNKSFESTVLKTLDIYKKNYTGEIYLKTDEELKDFFSIVNPKLKKYIDIKNVPLEELEKYIPKELGVKVYLDYDNQNRVVADIKFCYGKEEFNPLLNQEIKEVRNLVAEDEALEILRNTGFMLDVKNSRLILVDEEKIYDFLAKDIELYMKKFEVLATDNFKNRQIKPFKINSIGVRLESNLLNINIEDIGLDINEISQILERYNLKKKYYRLKDGNYINIENNNDIELLANMVDGMDIRYNEIKDGMIRVPIYRGIYLESILKKLKNTNITKDDNYKKIVSDLEIRENDYIDVNIKGLNADLRGYQKLGYRWLKNLDYYHLGGILADDMGLGKTIQILALILSYVEEKGKDAKPSIVICPSSLSLNWLNEIKKFAPSLKCIAIGGNAIQREKQINKILENNIVITSYELLKRDINIYKEKEFEFKYAIADEAQYIKNNNTQNARAIKVINAETRYALTGTPIENSLSELWSIFDYIMPGYLFGHKKFKEEYETPIVKDEDEKAMEKLKQLIEPFVLRRVKKEVLTELPDKTVTVLYNEMGEEQKELYKSYLAIAKKEVKQEISENGFEKSQIKILSLLMRLRQICCHPSLFLSNYSGESSKLNQCIEVLKDAISSGHKILLFSGYTSMFDIIEKELKKSNINYFKLTGQTKVSERVDLVDEFNTNPEIKVFLISLKAGGTGLNLTGADMVIHYDPWWNISAENQATDRTYRIGQKNNVHVYKMITKDSIEEKIYELQKRKEKLIDNMLSTKTTFINKLSEADIMKLFE